MGLLTRVPMAIVAKVGRLVRRVVRVAVLSAGMALVLIVLDALLLKDVSRSAGRSLPE